MSTGIHFLTSSSSHGNFSFSFRVTVSGGKKLAGPERFLSRKYRRKYHEESTNVSIVSTSRLASPPQFGHLTFTQSLAVAKGGLPRGAKSTSYGSSTGKSFSGTGMIAYSLPSIFEIWNLLFGISEHLPQ